MTVIYTETFDFTERDFQSADARLQSLQASVFPDMTDPNSSNFMNLMRSEMAWVLSRNDFYLTKAAREAFCATMEERRSAIYHGRRQGYELSGAEAATADLTVTLENGPLDGDVTITEGDIVKTQEVPTPIIGEVQSTVVITAGATSTTLAWRHSQSKDDTYTSNGKHNQRFKLSFSPYLDGSATFSTALGTWTEVETFLNSGPADLHFRVIVDEDDYAWVYFGDNVNGAVPDGTFTVYYEIGGGADGNVAQNSLTKFGKSYTDSLGNQAILTITNLAAASGGSDRETVAAARFNIPANRRLPAGTITREDFELRALTVSGVARALMLSSDEDSAVPEAEGRLYIVPSGGGTASETILGLVETEITVNYPQPIGFSTTVISANYMSVAIRVVVFFSAGSVATTVKTAILERLAHYFEPTITDGSQYIGLTVETDAGIEIQLDVGASNPFVNFGYYYRDEDDNPSGEIPLSDIYNVIRDTAGVRKISTGGDEFTLNGEHDDVQISNNQFPRLGTVTVIDGMTGAEI
jgi:hypothetical protein